MGSKPKAGKTKSKSGGKSRSKDEKSEKTQAERFIETARLIGVDESGREFDAALEKIARPKRRKLR
jgi:hypothetical protein